MKRYTIGLVSGILLTASSIMFLGAKEVKSNRIGRYQLSVVSDSNYIILDTQTSEHWVNKSDGTGTAEKRGKRMWEKGQINGNAPSVRSRKVLF